MEIDVTMQGTNPRPPNLQIPGTLVYAVFDKRIANEKRGSLRKFCPELHPCFTAATPELIGDAERVVDRYMSQMRFATENAERPVTRDGNALTYGEVASTFYLKILRTLASYRLDPAKSGMAFSLGRWIKLGDRLWRHAIQEEYRRSVTAEKKMLANQLSATASRAGSSFKEVNTASEKEQHAVLVKFNEPLALLRRAEDRADRMDISENIPWLREKLVEHGYFPRFVEFAMNGYEEAAPLAREYGCSTYLFTEYRKELFTLAVEIWNRRFFRSFEDVFGKDVQARSAQTNKKKRREEDGQGASS